MDQPATLRPCFGSWHLSIDRARPYGVEPLAEEMVVVRTSQQTYELHCHGGPSVVDAVLVTLRTAGLQAIDWRELVAYEEEDSFRADARVALAEALTSQAAAILLDQYHGALSRSWSEIDARRHAAASGDRSLARDIVARIDQLLDRSRVGLRLTRPWRVVLAGPPNVGKSSLINVLLGYERAVVFDQPGTTRDLLTAVTALHGWPVELTDTAGIHRAQDELEIQGIARAEAAVREADLVLLVSSPDVPTTHRLALDRDRPHLSVTNKCDLLAGGATDRDIDRNCVSALNVSALNGDGVETLVSEIVRHVVPMQLEPGDAVPFLQKHVDGLQRERAEMLVHC